MKDRAEIADDQAVREYKKRSERAVHQRAIENEINVEQVIAQNRNANRHDQQPAEIEIQQERHQRADLRVADLDSKSNQIIQRDQQDKDHRPPNEPFDLLLPLR